jgi:glutaredoxin
MSLVMYVKPGCPYCDAARAHFAAEGIEIEERDATQNADFRRELMTYTRNTGLVPTIVRSEPEAQVQVGFPPGRG